MEQLRSAVLKGAMDSSPSPMVITRAQGPDRPILYANAAFEELTGYSRGELLGRDCRFLQGADRDQPVLRDIREGLSALKPVSAIVRNYRKDGTPFMNEMHISPVEDDERSTRYFVGIQNALAFPELALLRGEAESLVSTLTRQERAVFEHLVRGLSNKHIGQEMGLSPRTVEKYRLTMLSKMGTSNMGLLVRYGVALGHTLQDG